MFLLDTNVVSELRKIRIGKADAHVARWADSVEAEDLYLSVITIQELEIGVLLAERRDAAQDAAGSRLAGRRVGAGQAREPPISRSARRTAALLSDPCLSN